MSSIFYIHYATYFIVSDMVGWLTGRNSEESWQYNKYQLADTKSKPNYVHIEIFDSLLAIEFKLAWSDYLEISNDNDKGTAFTN